MSESKGNDLADFPPHGLLNELGLDAKLLVAGFFGGIVNAFMMRRADPVTIVGSVVAGVLAANYLGSTVGYYIRVMVYPPEAAIGIGGFITGLTAMALVQAISAAFIKLIKQRLPNNGKPV